MSAVMEQPKPEVFESVNYFDRRVVGANVKRWVFFPGDLIVPQRKAEISWLQAGGEETTCPCLQKYGRGFIPRGIPALLELGGEPIPMRHLGELQASAWTGIPLNEDAVKNRFGFVPVYPGDGLRLLQRYSRNNVGPNSILRKGIDELTPLRGKSWEECHTLENDRILDVIEQAQFGDGMSKTLRGLEDQIRHAKVSDTRIDYGRMRDEELTLCEEFRGWASNRIAFEHGLLKSGTVPIISDAVGTRGGWAYAYSPMVEMLLDQLEVPRQDQPLAEMAKLVGAVINQPQTIQVSSPQQGLSDADMDRLDKRFEERMEQRLALAREADARRIAELEARVSSLNTDAGKIICERCGREFKKAIHLTTHQPHCKGVQTEQE